MAVTLKQVAAEADVSLSAVSGVLGKRRASRIGVSAATRERILTAAKQLGYQPDLHARALRGGRTQAVGLLWSMGGPHGATSMVRRIALLLRKRDYMVFPTEHLSDPQVTTKMLNELAMRRVDAVIVQGGTHVFNAEVFEQLASFPAAIIVSGEPLPDCRFDMIVHDRLPAYRAAADHFVKTGRRRPAIMAAAHANQSKIDAFVDQLRRGGMDPGPEAVIEVPRHGDEVNLVEYFAAAFEQHLARHGPIDALQCQSDEAAAGAMLVLRQHKLKVPEDVAVIGFNNSDWTASMAPPLASIERNDDRLAQLIEQMFFARLDQPDCPRKIEYVAMEFVHRASAGQQ